MIDFEIITELRRLCEIQDEWRELQDRVPFVTPFQSPEWLMTWWKHFGGGELRVYAFRTKPSELVGLVPAFLHTWEGRRQLTLIGSGLSDYLEPAVLPEAAHAVACKLWDCLSADPTWDLCNWQDLSAETKLVCCMEDRNLGVERVSDLPCSELEITQSFDEFWAGRSSGLRRNVRRYRDKAEQLAPLELNVVEGTNQACLNALIRLHSARWREQGEAGMIAANHSAIFLRDVVAAINERENVLFFSLSFQHEIAAVILCFPFRETLYAYLSAFDPAYAAFGFGRILLHGALQYAFSNKYKAWNFLRGTEPYKFEWGAREIKKARLLIRRKPAT